MDDMIRLKSGREIYANRGIIGIAPDLSVSEGYDGTITSMPNMYHDNIHWAGLTHDEIVELADIAIERWRRLKELSRVERA